ncbi:MAG: histidine phosphatase family protein [Candidatus Dormibacteraceae bacterium]
MVTARLVLVRHGGTEWTETERHTGRTDITLSAEGRRQADALGRRLRGMAFALVLTSPLARALETCRRAGLGDAAEPCPDAQEWDYGAYEGWTSARIHEADPDWSLWTAGAPDGESPAAVGARADRVLARVRPVAGDTILFAHGHFLRVLAARWLELAPSAGALFALSPAALCVLGYEHDLPVVWDWNDRAHLGGQYSSSGQR